MKSLTARITAQRNSVDGTIVREHDALVSVPRATFGQRLGGAVVDALLWLPVAALLAQVAGWLPALAVAAYEVGLIRDGRRSVRSSWAPGW